MELFIKVAFWLYVLTIVVRLGMLLVIDTWPRPRKPESLGECLVVLLTSIGFLVWSGLLLWG